MPPNVPEHAGYFQGRAKSITRTEVISLSNSPTTSLSRKTSFAGRATFLAFAHTAGASPGRKFFYEFLVLR